MSSTRANVKNEKQYEALKDKGMSKERAARIANSPGASSRGGKQSGSGGDSSQGGTTAQKKKAGRKGASARRKWDGRLKGSDKAREFNAALKGEVSAEAFKALDAHIDKCVANAPNNATRVHSGAALEAVTPIAMEMVGGSADLNPSTDTALKGMGDFQPPEAGGRTVQGAVGGEWDYGGRNTAFGVREHAMGAAVNGLVLSGRRVVARDDALR